MFVWAITGSPFIDPGANDTLSVSHQLLSATLVLSISLMALTIQIIISEENDLYYAESSEQAKIMMDQGRISF